MIKATSVLGLCLENFESRCNTSFEKGFQRASSGFDIYHLF